MPSNKKIIYVNDSTIVTPPIDELLEEEYVLEKFCSENDYDDSCVFVIEKDEDAKQVSGYTNKKIVDALMEADSFITSDVSNSITVYGCETSEGISVPEWFWYRECLSYGRDVPNHFHLDKPFDFLMPIRLQKRNRDLFVDELSEKDLLKDALWSYVAKGKCLEEHFSDDRHYEEEWYSSTKFSIVLETLQEGPMFITEKTFKPIQYKHPFMVFGITGTLSRLRDMGFQTFDNIFDEGYDEEADMYKRMHKIIEEISKSRDKKIYTAETIERITHNYNHFHNLSLVNKKIMTEIIVPIRSFIDD